VTRERVVDFAVVVVCVLLLVLIIKQAHWKDRTVVAHGYAVGDRVPPELLPSGARFDRALLLILHTQCTFCTESLPAFRAIDAERKTRSNDLRMFVLTREVPAVMQEYLRRHGLSVDGVIHVSRPAIRSAGFPTVLAIDAGGNVTGVWRGRVRRPAQESIIARVFAQ
jgi:hypothetical protein